jgi:hypothetical protein
MKTFRLLSNTPVDNINNWIRVNDMNGKISYNWINQHLVFENDEDATAFSLRFAIIAIESKIDMMLKNEKNNN